MPDEIPPVPRKRLWKRLGLAGFRWLAKIGVCVGLAYVAIHWYGNRRWRVVQARVEAAGETLDLNKIPIGQAPDLENFGATPALDGLARTWEPDKMPLDIEEKILRLKRVTEWRRAKERPWLQRDVQDWDKKEKSKEESARRPLTFDPPDDARASLDGWDRFQPLWTELEVNAHRPKAYLTPIPESGNLYQANRGSVVVKIDLLAATMSDIGIAALELGQIPRAENSLRVNLRLWQAGLSEQQYQLFPGRCTWWMERLFLAGVARHVWTSERLIEWQKEMEEHSIEVVALAAARAEGARKAIFWEDFHDKPRRVIAWKKMDVFPRGWVRQNQALYMECWLDLVVSPLKQGGLAAALGQLQSIQKIAEPICCGGYPWNIFTAQAFNVYDRFVFDSGFQEIRRRMMIVICAMERARTKRGAYPANLAQLIPEFLSAIPSDYDGQPLRLSSAPGRSSLWSVGADRKLDWNGQMPDEKLLNKDYPSRNLDWFLTVPLQ